MSKWLKSLLVLTLLIIPMEDGIFIAVNASENPTKIEWENIDINSYYGIPNIGEDVVVASGVVSDHQDSAKYTFYTSNVLRINDGYYNGVSGTDDFKKYMNQAEHLIIGDIQTVSLSKNFNNIYGDYQLLKTLQIDKVDLSNTTHLGYMFGSDSGSKSKLEMMDLGTHFNPEKVTNFSGMFKDLNELKYLNLGTNFKTTSGRLMDSMFRSLTKLVHLDLGNSFNTSNVSNMNHMFSNLTSLESLSLGDSFITKGVTQMNDMFSNLSKLDNLDLGNKFDTSSVTEMISMLSNTSKITSLSLGDKFNTSSTREMFGMFSGMENLETLKLGNLFNTSRVSSMGQMFYNTNKLKTLDLSSFTIRSITSISNMLAKTNLSEITLGLNIITLANSDLPSIPSVNITQVDGSIKIRIISIFRAL